MKCVVSYLSTEIKRNDFEGTLYYIKLNSEFVKDICLFMFDGMPCVITEHYLEPFEVYNQILKMVLDNDKLLDLFWIQGHQALGWVIPNHMTNILLQEIKKELI